MGTQHVFASKNQTVCLVCRLQIAPADAVLVQHTEGLVDDGRVGVPLTL